jgi:hypothetical protein
MACATLTLSLLMAISLHSEWSPSHRADVGCGSWPCQYTTREARGLPFSGFDYARIAAISGWTPMMLITLVRL